MGLAHVYCMLVLTFCLVVSRQLRVRDSCDLSSCPVLRVVGVNSRVPGPQVALISEGSPPRAWALGLSAPEGQNSPYAGLSPILIPLPH